MEFGKLDDISQVDFSFPQNHAKNAVLLPKKAANPQIWVGCPIWANPSWKGLIYPIYAKNQDFLYHYAQQFNCIELNATHYKTPDIFTIEKWKNSTPEGFKFCPKIPQSISHERQLFDCQELIEHFIENMRFLENRLGLSFLQVSPYFSPKKATILMDFLKSLPTNFPLAVELRHEDWFKNDEIFDELYKINIPTLITDVAGRRDVLHLRLTARTTAVRFVGNGLHKSDFERIDNWVKQVVFWVENGVEKLYFWIHQPDNLLAPQLADYFIKELNKHHFRLKTPQFYQKNTQKDLF